MKNFFERLQALKTFTPEQMRFWMKVDVRSPEECWPWTGGTASPDGKYYNGRFGVVQPDGTRKIYVASRYAFECFHGHPPEDQVLHSCDNGLCCNPWHLRDGSQSENIKEAIERGRFKIPTNPEGRKVALTDAQVVETRYRIAAGETQASIARDFGVSKATICRLVNNSRNSNYRAYGRVEGGPDN